MTDLPLDALAELDAARTPGPWLRSYRDDGSIEIESDSGRRIGFVGKVDAEFIAAMGTHGSNLIAECVWLREAIKRLADEWEADAMTCCRSTCDNCGHRYIDPDELRAALLPTPPAEDKQ